MTLFAALARRVMAYVSAHAASVPGGHNRAADVRIGLLSSLIDRSH